MQEESEGIRNEADRGGGGLKKQHIIVLHWNEFKLFFNFLKTLLWLESIRNWITLSIISILHNWILISNSFDQA